MKLFKWLFQCPLLFILAFSWLCVSAYAVSDSGFAYAFTKDFVQNPMFMALIDKDEEDASEIPDTVLADLEKQVSDEETIELLKRQSEKKKQQKKALEEAGGEDDAVGAEAAEEQQEEPELMDSMADDSEKVEVGTTEYEEYEPVAVDSPYYSDPGKYALTTTYPYETVDDSYFQDALFLGDSRTIGLQDYSGLATPTYLAKTGLNIYQLLDDPFVTEPKTGEMVNVTYMLKHYHYKKVYIMIGINELGTGNTGTFQKAYASVLSKIIKWQPEAIIYVQGIIAVSAKKNAEDAIINNLNINDKNVAISQLADGKKIFYLDINPLLTDKKGNLKADYTFDEVHLYAQYYVMWKDFLKEHAVVLS